jgi:hypothetical protein
MTKIKKTTTAKKNTNLNMPSIDLLLIEIFTE